MSVRVTVAKDDKEDEEESSGDKLAANDRSTPPGNSDELLPSSLLQSISLSLSLSFSLSNALSRLGGTIQTRKAKWEKSESPKVLLPKRKFTYRPFGATLGNTKNYSKLRVYKKAPSVI
jgi:hypothetical protein